MTHFVPEPAITYPNERVPIDTACGLPAWETEGFSTTLGHVNCPLCRLQVEGES